MPIRSLHPLYKYIVYLLGPWDIFCRTVASAFSFRVSFNYKTLSEVIIHNSLPTARKQDEFLDFKLCGSECQRRAGLAFHEAIYRNPRNDISASADSTTRDDGAQCDLWRGQPSYLREFRLCLHRCLIVQL